MPRTTADHFLLGFLFQVGGTAPLYRVWADDIGALRNLIRPGTKQDSQVDIVDLTQNTILPLVNSLLDIDLNAAVSQALQLAPEAVCLSARLWHM